MSAHLRADTHGAREKAAQLGLNVRQSLRAERLLNSPWIVWTGPRLHPGQRARFRLSLRDVEAKSIDATVHICIDASDRGDRRTVIGLIFYHPFADRNAAIHIGGPYI